jgi:alpha-2-macroglobulin
MSRVLPNAMVAQAFRKLGIRNEFLEADLPPMVDLGLQKLYGFQHNDGGWGWWYDDSTDVNQTAYVLLGLAMTEQAGFEVDGGVMDRGAGALQGMLFKADPRAQAYGAYVLAMSGRPFTVTLTLTDALGLDLFSQAALAIASAMGDDQATMNVLLDNLREAAIQDATTVHWSDEGDNAVYSRKVMGSTVRTTAMVADALARLDPESPLLPKAVHWLMDKRQGQGWADTQKTSFAILALSDYLLASQELAAGPAFQIYLNDELWQEGRLEQATAGQTLTVPLSALLPAQNRVQLVLGAAGEEPSGRLYYAVTFSASRAPQEGAIPALVGHERSIAVQREYRLHGSQEPATQFQQGDLVEVRLTLNVPEESWYVVVDDPLPAGFEALNERLGTTSHVGALYEEPVYTWEQYGYNRKDVRDERVTFFITHLEPGERSLTYLVRATTPGSFTALPAQVYPMYEPEVWSRSASTRCHIRSR